MALGPECHHKFKNQNRSGYHPKGEKRFNYFVSKHFMLSGFLALTTEISISMVVEESIRDESNDIDQQGINVKGMSDFTLLMDILLLFPRTVLAFSLRVNIPWQKCEQ
jgi:hypothetical protein